MNAIHQENGQVVGLSTTKGDIKTNKVVNCGGAWARRIADMANVQCPLLAYGSVRALEIFVSFHTFHVKVSLEKKKSVHKLDYDARTQVQTRLCRHGSDSGTQRITLNQRLRSICLHEGVW